MDTTKQVIKRLMNKQKDRMEYLRYRKFLTLEQIGKELGVSKQRVGQVLGRTGTGYLGAQQQMKLIGLDHLTNSEAAKETGLPVTTVKTLRRNTRFKVEGEGGVAVGAEWQEWAAEKLVSLGFEDVQLMPYKSKYNILVNQLKVRVRVSRKPNTAPSIRDRMRSPQWTFHTKTDRANCDFFMFITGNEDVFVVPAHEVPEHLTTIKFCWPTLRPELAKYQKYLDAFHLLRI